MKVRTRITPYFLVGSFFTDPTNTVRWHQAREWLGDRYLCSKPINRREDESASNSRAHRTHPSQSD